ncbi:MAG TPA: citrate transporter, partial [Usitatibacter sp.]
MASAQDTTTIARMFTPTPVMIGPVPVDFILFALILLGIAVFHHHTLRVSVWGLAAVTAYKVLFTGFPQGAGLDGLAGLIGHEWVILANLFGLLMGFALLSKHFEDSGVPVVLPKILPDDWKGGFLLLARVFVISSFLDNIAAALIGGAMARAVFRGKVHIGYLAAIVAASNAGGSGSVVGDTTTTMMWIAGVDPLDVLEAFVAAGTALVITGYVAARQQQRYSPIVKDAPTGARVDWVRVAIVAFILVSAIVANVVANLKYPEVLDRFPVIGAAVWAAILASAPLRRPDWSLLRPTSRGTVFLLALVTTAAMMPV